MRDDNGSSRLRLCGASPLSSSERAVRAKTYESCVEGLTEGALGAPQSTLEDGSNRRQIERDFSSASIRPEQSRLVTEQEQHGVRRIHEGSAGGVASLTRSPGIACALLCCACTCPGSGDDWMMTAVMAARTTRPGLAVCCSRSISTYVPLLGPRVCVAVQVDCNIAMNAKLLDVVLMRLMREAVHPRQRVAAVIKSFCRN